MKQQRWYEIIDGLAHVYDSHNSETSQSVSIVKIEDLKFYRNNFELSKVWK